MNALQQPPISLFSNMDSLVDERVGIVHKLRSVRMEAGAPAFFHFFAEACNTSAFCSQVNCRLNGGASIHRDVAMAKAIGEAVERYCAALYARDEFPLVTFDSATFPCALPSTFALYREEQHREPGFPFQPVTGQTPLRWVAARDMLSGEVCHVPACMVFVPYHYDRENGEVPIRQPISTGLACHRTPEEAAISAICEVIERDAFTIAWQARLSMPQIRLETLSEQNRDLVARFERTGARVTVLNLTMEHRVPTILSVLRSEAQEAPALVFAAASHLDPEEAARKSLEELAHTRGLTRHLLKSKKPLPRTRGYANIITQDDHVHFYADHRNARLADFIFASPGRQSFHSIENLSRSIPRRDLQMLLDRIHATGYRTLLADVTTPDVRELDLSVVRAVIPGFHPLVIGHRLRALGGTRLWEIPQRLGYKGIEPARGDNPVPHPYP